LAATYLSPQDQPSSLYSGKHLLGYKPHEQNRGKFKGAWTEMLTVSAISIPEANDLTISIGFGIRNFRDDASFIQKGSNRHIDLFFPADSTLATTLTRRHVSTDIPITREDIDLKMPDNITNTDILACLHVLKRYNYTVELKYLCTKIFYDARLVFIHDMQRRTEIDWQREEPAYQHQTG